MTGSSPLDSDRDRNDETIVRQRREGDTELGDARELEPPLVVGQKFGEYQILDLLGRGSSGFVYAAHDSVANRRLAIKVLCRNSPQDLCRNKLGFRRMSKLRHPRLLWAKGITQVERYCVLLMEEIEGYTLKKAIERISKLPKREAMHRFHVLLHDFATGLAVMHFNELVHRDLKPSNLMVRSDGRGVIVDYGLVAHCDTETDPRGIRSYIAGTPKYFSPEALWEQSYTPAGDVFSLGLVMLDCLKKIVGKEQSFRYGLFTEWDREEDERTIANLIADMDETIPPLLRMVIAEMLTQDRSERRSSMEVAAMTNLDDRPVRLKAAHHLFGRQDEMQACQSWIDAILKDGSGRLHLVGDAGAGKSSLLDDVERGLRQLRWGNVFRANCRSREIDRLQVMDQIADQVAQRYTRKDLKPLALHPVNVSVLVKAFPQLAHVLREIQVDEDQDRVVSFDCPLPERLDLVSAWGGLCQALLEAGPLFLIVDDAQWADTDGMKLLNDLQRAGMNSVGVITASREEASESAQTGTETLTIGPLNESAALAFLKATAERWGANINAAGLLELLDLAEGNPFRLRELAEEMRPEGLLHRVDDSTDASISNLGRSERLWQARLDRLSDDERAVLVLIVAAGTPVALADLAVLSGFGERTDGAVFELSRRRLVQDDATGQECIRIVGDAMTDGLIASFSEDDIREAHLCWAQLLSGQQRSKFLASRIAKHFYAAGAAGAALPYAIIAAEHADVTLAKREAGEWHERVLKQVTGDARDKHLRDAARCFFQADMPEKAAEYYVLLAKQARSSKDEQRLMVVSAILLIRCGRVDRARPFLVQLSREFGFSVENVGPSALMRNVANSSRMLLEKAENTPLGSIRPISRRDLRCCSELSASLAFFDVHHAIQLVSAGSERVIEGVEDNLGVGNEEFHFAAVSCLWDIILNAESGKKILNMERRLSVIRERLRHEKSHPDLAEFSRTLSLIKLFSMRWQELHVEVTASSEDFNFSNLMRSASERSEIGQLTWVQLWSQWHLGHWKGMYDSAVDMLEDSVRRADGYQHLVSTSGYAGNAFLIRGECDRLTSLCKKNVAMLPRTEELEASEFLCAFQEIQCLIYEGRFAAAASAVMSLRRQVCQSILKRITLIRTMVDHLTALVGLHQLARSAGPEASGAIISRNTIANSLRRLEAGFSPFARAVASLLRGFDHQHQGNLEEARIYFERAAEIADYNSLLPYQIAASDALNRLSDPEDSLSQLQLAMANQGASEPEKLERLYTVNQPSS